MPYIKQADRDRLKHDGSKMENAGELNYTITTTILQSDDPALLVAEVHNVVNEYMETHGLRYQYINDVMGALASAKLEFQARIRGNKYDGVFDRVAYEFYQEVARPYEDLKIVENGDCF